MKKIKLLACLAGAFMALSSMAFAEGDWDIKVFRPAVNPRDHKNDVMVRAGDKYTAETGGKVTYILGDWGTVESRVLSNMAAGDPIDVVFVRDQDFPKFKVKGYLQPINGYVNTNLTAGGENIFNYTAAEQVFKYDNKYYAASHYTANHFWLVIYNKTLMQEMGIKESQMPKALEAAGKWDWDHMAELARKLTADTTGSGSINRWGLGCWYTRLFAYMNGCEFTKKDSKGNLTLNFSDPKLTEALSFLESAKKAGWYQQDNSIIQDGIANRTCAMVIGREYDPATITKKTRDQLEYVKLPHGPSVSSCKNVFECDGYGIGAGSKKQKAAGKYIEYVLKEWYNDDILNRNSTWPKAILTMSTEMRKNTYYPGPTVAALDSMLDEFLGEVVWSGNSPASAIEKYTPKAQAILADANTPIGKLTKLPFKGVNQNFDKMSDSQLASYVKAWESTTTAKFSLVSGSGAIGGSGKSLKLEFDPDTDGTEATIVITDPTNLGIVGWRNYKVEFDAKAIGTVGKDAAVWMQGYANELYQYGWMSKAVSDNSTVYHVTGTIQNVNQNGRIGLAIGVKNLSGVIIDNIKITEK